VPIRQVKDFLATIYPQVTAPFPLPQQVFKELSRRNDSGEEREDNNPGEDLFCHVDVSYHETPFGLA
jgi:hypothetical protein